LRCTQRNGHHNVTHCYHLDIVVRFHVVPPSLAAAAQWRNMPPEGRLRTVDFKDTFLDAQHLLDSFPGHAVRFQPAPGADKPAPPFRLTFPDTPPPPPPGAVVTGETAAAAATGGSAAEQGSEQQHELLVQSYVPANPGPYPQNLPPTNRVRFTPVQVEAITSGALA
jgi:intron-binding protein aquarius